MERVGHPRGRWQMSSWGRVALLVGVCFLSGASCSTRPSGDSVPDPKEFRFPLETGNVWKYAVEGELWWSDGQGPVDDQRTDQIIGRVNYRGDEYSILSSTAERQALIRQEGTRIFWFEAVDTNATERWPFSDAVRASLPWMIADLGDPAGTVRTLVAAEDGEYRLRVEARYDGVVRYLPTGSADSMYAFRISIEDRAWLSEYARHRTNHTFYLRSGVGTVKFLWDIDEESYEIPGVFTQRSTGWLVQLESNQPLESPPLQIERGR
jgi:hypothetical protein